jgi:hypothetical protein
MNKIIKAVSIVCVLVIMILAISTIRADAKRQENWEATREIITIRIKSGDSLDGYWAEYAPEWMSREQYRSELKELNHLTSALIYADDIIKIYVEGEN